MLCSPRRSLKHQPQRSRGSPSHCAILPWGFSEMDINRASLEQTTILSRNLYTGQTYMEPRY